MNPTAIEAHAKLVLLQWMIIIAVAWLFGRLGRKIGQPLAVGEIFAGIVLGPSALGLIWPADWPPLFPQETQQSLQLLGKLGLILLLFQVGMEFDYGHLRSRSKTVTAVSLAGIIAPFLCGLAIGPWLHREFAPETPRFGFQLFLCIALSISALPIMGRILLELKLERTVIGAMGISAAAIDDVVGWILLAVAGALVTSAFSGWKLVSQIVGVIGFFLFLQLLVGPWLRRVWRRSASKHSAGGMSRSYLAVLLIVLFACCLATSNLGLPFPVYRVSSGGSSSGGSTV
jgi:Kef-type K+ transport system membrane component KefB